MDEHGRRAAEYRAELELHDASGRVLFGTNLVSEVCAAIGVGDEVIVEAQMDGGAVVSLRDRPQPLCPRQRGLLEGRVVQFRAGKIGAA